MPIRVYYNGDACTIRPTPFASIGTNVLKNGAGEPFGVTYTITLTGTLLADQGTPYGTKQDETKYSFYSSGPSSFVGPYGAFDKVLSNELDKKPPRQKISTIEASNSIFSKQKALRALFAKEGQRFEITDFNDDEATIICYPRLTEISFTEGTYVEKCDYTITLEADILLNKDNRVDYEGTLIPTTSGNVIVPGLTEAQLIGSLSGAFISDYSEDWSIETDESVGESAQIPRSYRISHSINAVGKRHFTETGVIPAWLQAKKFVQSQLSNNINNYPNIMGVIGSGTLNLVNSYGGYNHIRSEQVSESAGSYNVSENWLLASGSAYENYNLSISSTIDNPLVSVSIDGNIKGLSEISPSGFGGVDIAKKKSAYENALSKYYKVTNSGQFGLNSDIYKRANNAVAIQLNSQPRSVSVGANEYTGEINYNVQFDNRPTNIISGVLSEVISVSDTYPGDVFAIIPVIGRKTGPILQYTGSRTEYRRDASISLILDYMRVPYGSGRSTLLLQKPSVVEPTSSQLAQLIKELSPAQEPGIRKYFISPPQETWNPKEGTYSINLSWTYELSN